MSALAIENMSWDEKLRAMEELWESLSREEPGLNLPLGIRRRYARPSRAMMRAKSSRSTGTPRNANCVSALSESQDLADGARGSGPRAAILCSAKKKPRRLFLDALFSDIDSLELYAGIHMKVFDFHRLLAKPLSYAVYYKVDGRPASCFGCSTAGKSRRKPWKDETVSACQAASPC